MNKLVMYGSIGMLVLFLSIFILSSSSSGPTGAAITGAANTNFDDDEVYSIGQDDPNLELPEVNASANFDGVPTSASPEFSTFGLIAAGLLGLAAVFIAKRRRE